MEGGETLPTEASLAQCFHGGDTFSRAWFAQEERDMVKSPRRSMSFFVVHCVYSMQSLVRPTTDRGLVGGNDTPLPTRCLETRKVPSPRASTAVHDEGVCAGANGDRGC